jgi:hypothetical protein
LSKKTDIKKGHVVSVSMKDRKLNRTFTIFPVKTIRIKNEAKFHMLNITHKNLDKIFIIHTIATYTTKKALRLCPPLVSFQPNKKDITRYPLINLYRQTE